MPETVTTVRCSEVTLPVNPFVSNRYHFGMLLGVDDLETEQAYHRGKMWLHNAWLHGTGVVWGLDVEVRADHGEVVVHPGLAIDAHGRELFVASEMCVDLAAWYADRRPSDLTVVENADGIAFDIQVELCHDSCLDRPVPSISEPCDGASLETAYSRAVERGWPRLVVPRNEPVEQYALLRQFFGQEAATHPLVVQALAEVAASGAAARPATCLRWFRRIAAADVTALKPETDAPGWSPFAGDGCVLLADLHVRLRKSGGRYVVVESGTEVDVLVRPAHVRTRTIQELLCGCGCGGEDSVDPGAPPGTPHGPPAADPLRAVADSATLTGSQLTVGFTRPLNEPTVHRDAFAVAVLRADGWADVAVRRAEYDEADLTVTLSLGSSPRVRPVRVVVRGTGATPILAVDHTPLCGVTGDVLVLSGADAALMIPGTTP